MDEDIKFLYWLGQRLVYIHHYNNQDIIILKLKELIQKLLKNNNNNIVISSENLDKILAKYYVDFYLEKSETLGFTAEERNNLRKHILDICQDIVSLNIPSETLIKDK